MAQRIRLEVEPRTAAGKQVKRLRRAGVLPGNIYGHGDSHAIQAPVKAVEALVARGGRSGLVDISVGGNRPQPALLKSLVRHPVSGAPMHVEFQTVSLSETVSTSVPVRFHGDASAVRQFGGILLHGMSELKVETVASNLPEALDVDLTPLNELGSSIKVSDLTPPEGVILLDPPESIIATVTAPRVQTEIEPSAEPAETADTTATAATPPPADATEGDTTER